MQWIKYQVLCNEGKNIFIDKKIEYTEANLAIAQSEAYNGQYYIIEDSKTYIRKPLGIEFGGTNADSPKSALINLGAVGKDEFNNLNDVIAEIDREQKATTRLVEYLHKMEHGVKYAFEEDSEIGYSKHIPSGAKMAAIKMFGGSIIKRKSLNLLPFPYYTKNSTTSGMTFEIDDNGVLHISGTPDSNSGMDYSIVFVFHYNFVSILEKGTVMPENGFISFNIENDTNSMIESRVKLRNNDDEFGITEKALSKDDIIELVAINVNVNSSNVGKPIDIAVKVMLNIGSSPLPFEPPGHNDSKVIEGTGNNLYSGGDIEITNNHGYVEHQLRTPLLPGVYTVSATINATNSGKYVLFTFLGGKEDGGNLNISLTKDVRTSKTVTIGSTVTTIRFLSAMGASESVGYTSTWKDIMLNEGETALPYEPYYGAYRLLSAKVTEFESAGANLWGFGDKEFTGRERVIFPSPLPAGTYTFSAVVNSNDTDNETTSAVFLDEDGVSARFANGFIRDKYTSVTVNFERDIYSVRLYASNNDANSNDDIATWSKIMLNEGSMALPYEPYRKSTLSIPEAVQAIDGYGWGVSDTVYNYVDWEKKQFVKRVGKIDLGDAEWAVNTDSVSVNSFFSSNILLTDLLRKSWGNSIINRDYTFCSSRNTLVDKGISLYNATDNYRVCVADSSYTDAATFKAAMSGNMLYYELAEPVITGISELLTDDCFIDVQGHGTLTFVNEHEIEVPNEIEYLIDLREVTL